jgi:hypothetical protein
MWEEAAGPTCRRRFLERRATYQFNGPGVQRTKRPDTAEEAAVGEEAAAGGGEAGGREPWGGVAGV